MKPFRVCGEVAVVNKHTGTVGHAPVGYLPRIAIGHAEQSNGRASERVTHDEAPRIADAEIRMKSQHRTDICFEYAIPRSDVHLAQRKIAGDGRYRCS